MCASRTGGVGDTELVGVEQERRPLRDLQCLLLLVQSKLLGCDGVDQPVADCISEESVFSLCGFELVGVDAVVFGHLLFIVEL